MASRNRIEGYMDKAPIRSNPLADPVAAYEHALARQESELNQLSQRNSFFIVFQGVLIAGYLQAGASKAMPLWWVALLGMVISFLHVRAAEAARHWFEWANGVVKYMEQLLAEDAARQDGTVGVYLYYTAGLRMGSAAKRAEGFHRFATGEHGSVNAGWFKQPADVVFLQCCSVIRRLFGAHSSCNQYVFSAYAFLVFWVGAACWSAFTWLR